MRPSAPNLDRELARRRDRRYELVLKVVCHIGEKSVATSLTQLSRGGLRLETTVAVTLGQQVPLTLSFPGLLPEISVRGEVRWIQPTGATQIVGIAFRDLSGVDRQRIHELVGAEKRWDRQFVVSNFRAVVFAASPIVRAMYEREAKDFAELHDVREIEVITVGDARALSAAVASQPADLVIVDADGTPDVECMCERLQRGDAALILLGTSTPTIAALGNRCTYLAKPARFGTLLQTIATLLRVNRRRSVTQRLGPQLEAHDP